MATTLPDPVQIRSRVRVRSGLPNTSAPVVRRLEPGAILQPIADMEGESVAGNAKWYEIETNGFIWSGACGPLPGGTLPASVVAGAPQSVLTEAQIKAEFGSFSYTETRPRGAIEIERAWIAANLTEIDTPMLARTRHPKLTMHNKAAAALQRALQSLVSASLDDQILTCAGTWVARHKTWNPARSLSPHSWGIAIDINAEWNGYGVRPPALGQIGSVRELIPYFAAEGFFWGGNFSTPDGMHFEYARTGT
jgi:hypothetical protein